MMQKISFVIPCYRSENTLEGVVEEIREAMSKLQDKTWELVLVNDASPDGTLEVIKKLCRENDNITGIDFARNFGQHSALMAGMRETTGDIVICLDDDGQTPPSEAYKLIGALEDGADVAYAKYGHKKHSLFRNFGSWVNEKMTEYLLEKPKELFISSYFAAKRFIVDEMLRYENSYPYVMGLVLRTTRKIVNVDVEHRSRAVGESGYTLTKLLGLWMNGFTAFSVKPLRIATMLGVFFAMAGFVYGIVIVIQHFVLPDREAGFASIISLIALFGGIVMIMLGLIGEYLGRIYICMNASPQYVIRERIKNVKEQ